MLYIAWHVRICKHVLSKPFWCNFPQWIALGGNTWFIGQCNIILFVNGYVGNIPTLQNRHRYFLLAPFSIFLCQVNECFIMRNVVTNVWYFSDIISNSNQTIRWEFKHRPAAYQSDLSFIFIKCPEIYYKRDTVSHLHFSY